MTDRTITTTASPRHTARVPRQVLFFSGFLERLLRAGVPLGPNRLITIRGRTTGLPRTVAIAVLNVGGRRWVWAPWGDVNWVRNLRAAGEATIADHGREEHVRAVELDPSQRVAFFRDVLGPFAAAVPGGRWFVRLVDGVDLKDPVEAANGRVVFELLPRG